MMCLKKEFGDDFHIHMYTVLTPKLNTLRKLYEHGLDELRFHPVYENLAEYERCAMEALSLGIEVGFEVPAYEDLEGTSVWDVVKMCERTGCFLNLNELEFSDGCAENLRKRGLHLKNDEGCAVAGSRELAVEIANSTSAKLHFCSSSFKDSIQLRNRLRRTAKRVARRFDIITEDGTLLYGVVEGDNKDILGLLEEMGVPEYMYDVMDGLIETSLSIAVELSSYFDVWFVERYPTWDRLVVEMEPIGNDLVNDIENGT
jgi:hypothetical protein